MLPRGFDEVIGREIHHNEFSRDEAEAVGTGLQGLTANLQRDFTEQISLIFLLNGSGVAGAIDETGQNVEVISKMQPARVAKLSGGHLTTEKDMLREGSGSDVRGLKDSVLPGGWAA